MTAAAPKLADVQWTWRRVFAYGATALNSLLLGFVIHALTQPDLYPMVAALQIIGVGLMLLQALLIVAYMMGATATDLRVIELARHTTTTVNRTETGT